MANKRLAMSKKKEIIRLKEKGLSERQIARALKCSRNTVKQSLSSNVEIEAVKSMSPQWVLDLDWAKIYSEVHQGVPLNVLWEERYELKQIPTQYPGFWKQFYRKYPSVRDATMVKQFLPGERAEIDYCDGIDIFDIATGEIISTQLFVGVLCNSRFTFAEFTYSQKSIDFLSSHVRMFEFFGGVPATLAPDNLKSAVTKSHPYDPVKNQAYVRLAEYYDVAITPARVRTPKDKALVERTVQIFQKWFYYLVRKRTFTSIIELNKCLKEHIEIFHNKKHRILGKTRNEMFEVESKELQQLPATPYKVSTHKKATLHADCHLQFEKTYYSSPYHLRGKRLDVWATDKIVEICHESEVVAVHTRSYENFGYRTDLKHYPPQHKAYLEVTPSNLRDKAKAIGESTYKVINSLMSVRYPLKFLRRAQGIVALSKKYTPAKLEAASKKAILYEKYNVPFIEDLIKNLSAEVEEKTINRLPNPHLRGEEIYH